MHHASREDMGAEGERVRQKQREPYSNWHHADNTTVRKKHNFGDLSGSAIPLHYILETNGSV